MDVLKNDEIMDVTVETVETVTENVIENGGSSFVTKVGFVGLLALAGYVTFKTVKYVKGKKAENDVVEETAVEAKETDFEDEESNENK